MSRNACHVDVCEKETPPEKEMEDNLWDRQMRGWRAASADGLQGQGSRKRSDLFTDTSIDAHPSDLT